MDNMHDLPMFSQIRKGSHWNDEKSSTKASCWQRYQEQGSSSSVDGIRTSGGHDCLRESKSEDKFSSSSCSFPVYYECGTCWVSSPFPCQNPATRCHVKTCLPSFSLTCLSSFFLTCPSSTSRSVTKEMRLRTEKLHMIFMLKKNH